MFLITLRHKHQYPEDADSLHDETDTCRRAGEILNDGDVILLERVQRGHGGVHRWHRNRQLLLAFVLET